MQIFERLTESTFYHIHNRGINSEKIFTEERNYDYFMKLYWEYISPIADTYCFSLLKSSFHFLIRIKDILPLYEPPFRPPSKRNTAKIILPDLPILSGVERKLSPSNQFSNFFNAYAQAINKAYDRTGGLFQTPFRRKSIHSESNLRWIINSIHQMPEHYELIDDFRKWPYSSWHSLHSNHFTHLKRNDVMSWFGGYHQFIDFHLNHPKPGKLILPATLST